MILEAETTLVIGAGTAVTIIVAIIGGVLTFVFLHFNEIGKHKEVINSIREENHKQDGEIKLLHEKVSSQQNIINRFTDNIFELAAKQEKEKK